MLFKGMEEERRGELKADFEYVKPSQPFSRRLGSSCESLFQPSGASLIHSVQHDKQPVHSDKQPVHSDKQPVHVDKQPEQADKQLVHDAKQSSSKPKLILRNGVSSDSVYCTGRSSSSSCSLHRSSSSSCSLRCSSNSSCSLPINRSTKLSSDSLLEPCRPRRHCPPKPRRKSSSDSLLDALEPMEEYLGCIEDPTEPLREFLEPGELPKLDCLPETLGSKLNLPLSDGMFSSLSGFIMDSMGLVLDSPEMFTASDNPPPEDGLDTSVQPVQAQEVEDPDLSFGPIGTLESNKKRKTRKKRGTNRRRKEEEQREENCDEKNKKRFTKKIKEGRQKHSREGRPKAKRLRRSAEKVERGFERCTDSETSSLHSRDSETTLISYTSRTSLQVISNPQTFRQSSFVWEGMLLAVVSGLLFMINNFVLVDAGVSPVDAILVRGTVHSILLAAYYREEIWCPRVGFVMLQGLCGALGLTAALFSVTLMPIPDALTILFTSPLPTLVLSLIFLGEKLTLQKTMSMLLLISGVVLVCKPSFFFSNEEGVEFKTEVYIGISLAVVSSVLSGVSSVIISKCKAVPSGVFVFWVAFAALCIATVGEFTVPGCYILTLRGKEMSVLQWSALFGLSFSSLLAFLSLSRSLKMIAPTLVSSLRSLEILVSFAIQAILDQELPDYVKIIGATLVFTGISLAAIQGWLNRPRRGYERID